MPRHRPNVARRSHETRRALLVLLILSLLGSACTSGTSGPGSAPTATTVPSSDRRSSGSTKVDAPAPDVVQRSPLGTSSSLPPCTIGGVGACHGWANTIVAGSFLPFV